MEGWVVWGLSDIPALFFSDVRVSARAARLNRNQDALWPFNAGTPGRQSASVEIVLEG
jgi:hypothetical protein